VGPREKVQRKIIGDKKKKSLYACFEFFSSITISCRQAFI